MIVSRNAVLYLGTRIKKARKQAGLTQEQLSEYVGVSRSAISKWESGEKEPNIKNLAELAKVLAVSTDYLLGLEENDANRSVTNRLSPVAEKALAIMIREIEKEAKHDQN